MLGLSLAKEYCFISSTKALLELELFIFPIFFFSKHFREVLDTTQTHWNKINDCFKHDSLLGNVEIQ